MADEVRNDALDEVREVNLQQLHEYLRSLMSLQEEIAGYMAEVETILPPGTPRTTVKLHLEGAGKALQDAMRAAFEMLIDPTRR